MKYEYFIAGRTRNKDNILSICEIFDELNISYVKYTGEEDSNTREYNKKKFIKKEADILLATSPVSTGVNGLQEVSNKIIVISYPWTGAEWEQLVGRINRQGSNFDSVTIIHPHVYINTNSREWNYDKRRWNIIKNKKTLSDVVVDGKLDSIYKLNRLGFIKDIINSLKENKLDDFHPERNDIKIKYEFTEQEYKNSESIIKDVHRKANTSTSEHMHNWFVNNPNEWKEYHKQREVSKSKWDEDPVDIIAKEINERNDNNIIADMGCGLAKLSTLIKEPNKVISIDHYSEDPNVDAVGACVGINGARVNAIVEELRGEKIDIIRWSENSAEFIEQAISPARVISVEADDDEKTAYVVVPDNQLSLAIGKEGQNARLAARLTGYRIDIKSESQARELEQE